MNFRKNSILIIGCSIALVLLLAALFFLIKAQGVYQENVGTLKAAKNELNRLNTRDPYPSAENVSVVQDNFNVLKLKYEEIWGELVDRQLQAKIVEPARFAPLLEDAGRRIRDRAAEKGVVIAPELTLGFREYSEGKLPPDRPEIMKRLVLELNAIEDIALRIIDSKVKSLDAIERDTFEKDVEEEQPEDTRRGRRSARRGRDEPTQEKLVLGLPSADRSELYTTERVSFEFLGWENTVWEVLNVLAGAEKVYHVVDVTFQNTNQDVGKPVDLQSLLGKKATVRRQRQPTAVGMTTGTGEIPEVTVDDLSREDRIVGGLEPIRVKLIIDMYHFRNKEEGGDQPEGGA